MECLEAIQGRRSYRAFLPDPVPREIIQRLLASAGKAPSAINIQPWEFIVVAGKEKNRLADRLLKAHRERQISCGPGTSRPLPEPWVSRPRQLFQDLQETFAGGPAELNEFILEGSCRFYDAPVALLVCLDELFPDSRMLCVGLAVGYLLLAAEDIGLGACPIGLITAYEEEIKDQLNISETKKILLGIALGYPDKTAVINRFRSKREDMGNLIRWIT
jgi:nitroreductase